MENTFSRENLDKVKEFLQEAIERQNSPIPILHNRNTIILQYNGWSINLHDDGAWEWEDTTGG